MARGFRSRRGTSADHRRTGSSLTTPPAPEPCTVGQGTHKSVCGTHKSVCGRYLVMRSPILIFWQNRLGTSLAGWCRKRVRRPVFLDEHMSPGLAQNTFCRPPRSQHFRRTPHGCQYGCSNIRERAREASSSYPPPSQHHAHAAHPEREQVDARRAHCSVARGAPQAPSSAECVAATRRDCEMMQHVPRRVSTKKARTEGCVCQRGSVTWPCFCPKPPMGCVPCAR